MPFLLATNSAPSGILIGSGYIGLEMVEVNPLVDNTYRSRQVAVRIVRELMTGMALRKKGITDPYYVDQDWIRLKKQ